MEITTLTKAGGRLSKCIRLAEDGTIKSDGSACVMWAGSARRTVLADLTALADHIGSLPSRQAIALGALRPGLPDIVQITTAENLSKLNGHAAPDLIARVAGEILYAPGAPALALIDVDSKGLPMATRARIEALGGFWPALASVLPGLEAAGRVMRRSTSSGLYNEETGEQFPASHGLHIYVPVADGGDVERFLKTFHARCWLAGLGWHMVGRAGQLLERSLVDRTVCAPERLVFEGAPLTLWPLKQDQESRKPVVHEGAVLNTRVVCPDLTLAETAKLRDLMAADRWRVKPEAEKAEAAFVQAEAERIVKRAGCSPDAARRAVSRLREGVLRPDIVLPFDDPELEGATVGDVLADPDRFVGATLADPQEGVDYGRCKAKIMRRADGTLWIHSFAHGRTVYDLRHTAATIEAALRACDPRHAADRLVTLLLEADLTADEEQRLRQLAMERAEVKAKPLNDRLKAARAEQKQQRTKEERERRAAQQKDARLTVPVPPPDAERLPVLSMLDDILGGVDAPEPPMRDIDGHPVAIVCRAPLALHELSSGGSNEGDGPKDRLPAPALPLLTRHSRITLAHEIERYARFVVEDEEADRAVALPVVFVDHFLEYRESILPRVVAIVTAPLVLMDGALLARQGLDRARSLVFRIEPGLVERLPDPRACDKHAAAIALNYLANEWLRDVATDFAGKCVLIALALTILERVLLPERPAFFVTAGKRGGGKTTALSMVIAAVTGKKPAAAAWAAAEDERRKAMLAHLSEGLAALVWDNLPLGSAISCKTLEAVLTADTYTDRILGQSANMTVPAHTIMAFTGNNIAPKGDLASRSLITRLTVDRTDPENREFAHADPIGWTMDNRAAILGALYTLLLSNPQLREPKPAKTRFKTWWHLIGSAIEHAARALTEMRNAWEEEERNAHPLDFVNLFLLSEGEDEATAGLIEVLEVLSGKWGTAPFQASGVAEIINDPPRAYGLTGDASQEKIEAAMNNAHILRDAITSGGRNANGMVSSKTVGRWLETCCDAPVGEGTRVLTLKREKGGKHAAVYRMAIG